MIALRERLHSRSGSRRAKVSLSYITSRGSWYHVSWKAREEKSGGIGTNIGVHFFDLLIWLFGSRVAPRCRSRPSRMGGELELEAADVTWFLSTDRADLPVDVVKKGQSTYRLITIDGEPVEVSSEGFTDLAYGSLSPDASG
jgi:UDP-N-acetyl-2-amino-2-deoxyglucuronate dehydrogenase